MTVVVDRPQMPVPAYAPAVWGAALSITTAAAALWLDDGTVSTALLAAAAAAFGACLDRLAWSRRAKAATRGSRIPF